jgi:hypothetical protein
VFEQGLSDPHYLDGDGDGVACEEERIGQNHHDVAAVGQQ